MVTDGSLVITATDAGASALKCQYGTCKYTSARFNTQGKFQQAYGRFEARIQIPQGQGLWPAFWTLGDNIGSAGWPTCGEIDIMENVGKEPTIVHGSLHGPGYSGGKALTGQITSDAGALGDDFHVYDIEWAPDVVRFYLDGALYETRTNKDVPAGDKWVYDHPFFVILNVAVGRALSREPGRDLDVPADDEGRLCPRVQERRGRRVGARGPVSRIAREARAAGGSRESARDECSDQQVCLRRGCRSVAPNARLSPQMHDTRGGARRS